MPKPFAARPWKKARKRYRFFVWCLVSGVIAFSVSGTPVTSFQLSSSNSGTLPFSIGLGFKKGDIPNVPVLDMANYQSIVKRRWSDNSVKHAVVSGRAVLTANVPLTINVSDGALPAGTNLVSADIAAAAPSASIQLGTFGTVNLSSLLSTPFRTWISGPEMVECHYRSSVGSDASLNVWFHVRLYKTGRVWIRAIVENGYLGVSVDKSYAPAVTIGGAVVYNNGGASLTHYGNTRWCAEGWIGGDPAVTPRHNTQYLMDTKLVPNYWKRNPSASALNGLVQTYQPMNNGPLEPNMGDAGYQPSIGLLPLWDALYVTSGGDARAYRACLTASSSVNSYPINWRDPATQGVVKPSSNPAGLASYEWTAGALTWEMAHFPSEGYLAYLITGDYWHYESMMMNAAMPFILVNGVGDRGTGLNCILTGQTRGTAWTIRSLAQLDAISPGGDAIAAEYQTLLANNMAHWKAVKDGLTTPGIGDVYEYGFPYGAGIIAPWQQHFFDQSVGMGSDLEPLPDMSVYNEVRDYLSKWPVGILGDSSGFYFNYAMLYNAAIANGTDAMPTNFFTTWKAVWNATVAAGLITNPVYDKTLKGESGGDPGVPNGYWGNLMPAIAYAVDHGAPGASAAWARLTGASNWSVVASAGYDDIPIWGIVPRSYNHLSSVDRNAASRRQFEFSVFPNPAKIRTTIQINCRGNAVIQNATVYDLRGKVVADLSGAFSRKTSVEWKPNGLLSGIYLLKLKTNGKTFSQKVVLQM